MIPPIGNENGKQILVMRCAGGMYQNQLALEAALMELTLQVEAQGHAEVGENVRGALYTGG